MSDKTAMAIRKMIDYNSPDLRRINHALKVFGFASAIGAEEGLDGNDLEILEAAAVFHDIGIHKAEEIYNCASGDYQQKLGPDVARPQLLELGYSLEQIEKICYLIGHHHTYTIKDNPLLQMLIEADFIVNIDEKDFPEGTDSKKIRDKIFVTETGKKLINALIIKKAN
ncbi:MAG: HD domain-containing protein [Lachnospiraceae bacterium]|nr:HD domain-containing protein [Lachnospiraceae bacterium]